MYINMTIPLSAYGTWPLFLLCAWWGTGLGLLLGQLLDLNIAVIIAFILPLLLGKLSTFNKRF